MSGLKHHKTTSPGYLVCKKCNGFYQLEDGEAGDDFDECQCGGELVFHRKKLQIDEKRDFHERLERKLQENRDKDKEYLKKSKPTKDFSPNIIHVIIGLLVFLYIFSRVFRIMIRLPLTVNVVLIVALVIVAVPIIFLKLNSK